MSGKFSRSFSYDGLSRLTSENNPESGITTYTYDYAGQEGDLRTRVQPRANQTDSNVTTTTTYTYDALHRLKVVDYGDPQVSFTWPLNFTYDQTPVGGHSPAYPKGRLTQAISPMPLRIPCLATTPWVARWMSGNARRFQGQNCTTGTHLTLTYDKLGELTSLLNAGDNITLTYGYNNAAELNSVTSSRNTPPLPSSLLSITSFDAWGHALTELKGDGKTTSLQFNNRGFLTSVGVSNLFSVSMTYAPNGQRDES